MRKNYLYAFLTPVLLVVPLLSVFKQSTDKVTTSAANDSQEYRIKKVVIDAGHGGHDSGCRGASTLEKHNTLSMALSLGAKIEAAFPNIEVIYTRDHDVFVELHRRADIANKAKADLFISIHCNSTDVGHSAYGTETYVLGMHRKEDNFAVAKRENASILLESNYEKTYDGFDPNSDEAYIIFNLFQNAYLEKSILFGRFVEESLKNNAGRRSLGVKQAGFLVLRETTMPSVLIETGFLNNPSEGAFISSRAGQETIAESILLAFKRYKNTVENSPKVQAEAQKAAKMPYTEGVVFKVQLATSGQDMSHTQKWQAVEGLEVVQENGVYKYFYPVGSYEEGQAVLKEMRPKGFKDAFIVAYRGGKRIGLDEARRPNGGF